MKKNLLFVIPSLSAGGGEKSLITLLNQIDYSRYNVDLFLFNHEGLFTKYVPNEVMILPTSENQQLFSLPLTQSVYKLLVKKKILLSYYRLVFSIQNRFSKNTSISEQRNWRYLSKFIEELKGQYDIAIGFLEKTSTYFCVDKVIAKKKIGWVHIDYDRLGMNPLFDIRYFGKLNHIVTVSKECAVILKNRFPSQGHKIEVIHNIVSPKMIKQLADQVDENVFNRSSTEEINILSVGRLHYQKGFEIAIEACEILVNRGLKIKWHIIGDGNEKNKLINLIKAKQLENNFKLLGLRSNPYPYMKQADIYVQTSRFEGKSIAIDEAKILGKPILVTNFPTAKDQIINEINGLIVEINPIAVADGVEKLIRDQKFRDKVVQNLVKEELGTEGEIYKLYKMFGESDEEKDIVCNE